MAKAVSNEELQLRKRARRRLVGAVALVVVVVVFLPMVLDNEPKPLSEDIAINIPAAPGEDEDEGVDSEPSEPQPLHFRPIEPSSDETGSAGAVSQGQTDAGDEQTASAPDSASGVKPTRRPQTEARAASAAEDGFAVQLGAFSDADNAMRLANTVSDARFTAYTEEVTTSGGKRTRVRVGPYPTRAAAEEASQRLKARKLTYGEPVIVRLTD